MLERISHVLKNRKAEGDKGFSLVELAVVIVIIGILAAIAIPVFSGIQDGAKQANADALAANASSIVAGQVAQGKKPVLEDFSSLTSDTKAKLTITGSSLTNFCVKSEYDGKFSSKGAPAGSCADPTTAITTSSVSWS